METITKETIKKLRQELKVELEPVVIQLWKEGQTYRQIERAVQAHKQAKIKRFYKPIEENLFQRSLRGLIDGADSKAEVVFYDLLSKNGIPFEFQVKIGNYRVDFLIKKYLVFEGDGPDHTLTKDYDDNRDKYLEKMGYKVFRSSWELVAQMPNRFIEVIKEEIT